VSDPRRSAKTARYQSLQFEPLRQSGRRPVSGRGRDRAGLRGRPSNETQRLTPLQANLLGEVRDVRGTSARLGGRLPLQAKQQPLDVARRASGSVSVRLVRAVSGRIAQPLRKLTGDERFLARWTLLVTAVSAPLAMLCFTLLVGLDLPARRAASAGAKLPTAEPQLRTRTSAGQPRAAAQDVDEAPQQPADAEPLVDLGRARGGGVLAALAARDRLAEGHEPRGSVAAGVRHGGRHPEDLALAGGGFATLVGTPAATRSGARRVPLSLVALSRGWRELTLEVAFPQGWRLLGVRPGQTLYEAGATLEATPGPGRCSIRIARPEGAEAVADGEVAVLEFDEAPHGGELSVRVAPETESPGGQPPARESRVVLD